MWIFTALWLSWAESIGSAVSDSGRNDYWQVRYSKSNKSSIRSNRGSGKYQMKCRITEAVWASNEWLLEKCSIAGGKRLDEANIGFQSGRCFFWAALEWWLGKCWGKVWGKSPALWIPHRLELGQVSWSWALQDFLEKRMYYKGNFQPSQEKIFQFRGRGLRWIKKGEVRKAKSEGSSWKILEDVIDKKSIRKSEK